MVAYQPGLFGYSVLFGCTLLALTNSDRFFTTFMDPHWARHVRA